MREGCRPAAPVIFSFCQQSLQELMAEQEHDLDRIGLRNREKGAVGQGEAVGHQAMKVRVKSSRMVGRRDEDHLPHHRSRVVDRILRRLETPACRAVEPFQPRSPPTVTGLPP